MSDFQKHPEIQISAEQDAKIRALSAIEAIHASALIFEIAGHSAMAFAMRQAMDELAAIQRENLRLKATGAIEA